MVSVFDGIIPNEQHSPMLKDEKSREYDSDSTLSQYGSERSFNVRYLTKLDNLTSNEEFANQLDSYLQVSQQDELLSDDDDENNKENQDYSFMVPESPDLSVCIDSPLGKKSVLEREWSESPIQKMNSSNTESVSFLINYRYCFRVLATRAS